jgi:hypothetical protein
LADFGFSLRRLIFAQSPNSIVPNDGGHLNIGFMFVLNCREIINYIYMYIILYISKGRIFENVILKVVPSMEIVEKVFIWLDIM